MFRKGWPVALAVAVLALAGCGGGGTTGSSSTSATTTAAPSGRLTEAVHAAGSKSGSRVVAQPGVQVLLTTAIGGSDSSGTQRVTVAADTGPANVLHVTATSSGRRSSAQIHGRDGKRLTLEELRYSCTMAPAVTFCPAQSISSSSHDIRLTFSAGHQTGISISAVVGPVAGPKIPAASPGGLPTTAYVPTELVRARPESGAGGASSTTTSVASTTSAVSTTSAASTTSTVSTTPALSGTSTTSTGAVPAPSTVASPGYRVAMITRLKGLPHGEPQQTTITIQKGPAKALTVAAAVAAAPTSRATVTGAGGAPISLAPPSFSCAVRPLPTFCPPSRLENQRHQYKLVFSASPHSPPIVLVARVLRP